MMSDKNSIEVLKALFILRNSTASRNQITGVILYAIGDDLCVVEKICQNLLIELSVGLETAENGQAKKSLREHEQHQRHG